MHTQLSYRPLRRTDLAYRQKWLNDPETNQYLGTYARKGTNRRFHEEWFDAYFKDKNRKIFLVLADKRPIGQVGLLHINTHDHNAELYVVIGEKEYRGKGLGKHIVQFILEYGRATLGLHRISLSVHAANLPAVRCYHRCGFVDEGVLKGSVYRDGVYEDEIVMAFTE
jgi:RimJ/RimL family protein N-acetyltransferase